MSPDNIVFQYRVDFKAPDDLSNQTGKKFYLMNQHRENLPLFLFDGTVLFTIQKLSKVSLCLSLIIIPWSFSLIYQNSKLILFLYWPF